MPHPSSMIGNHAPNRIDKFRMISLVYHDTVRSDIARELKQASAIAFFLRVARDIASAKAARRIVRKILMHRGIYKTGTAGVG